MYIPQVKYNCILHAVLGQHLIVLLCWCCVLLFVYVALGLSEVELEQGMWGLQGLSGVKEYTPIRNKIGF